MYSATTHKYLNSQHEHTKIPTTPTPTPTPTPTLKPTPSIKSDTNSIMSAKEGEDKSGKAAAKSTGQDSMENETLASGGKKALPTKESIHHRGKWTNEECEYMLGLMEAFKAGHLPLREGTTLRSFLSSMMKCKPKRISKKFEGISYQVRFLIEN
jgi:hypothetical protein